jgi:hypothetical protein
VIMRSAGPAAGEARRAVTPWTPSRPLTILIGPGQGRDAPACLPVLDAIRVTRLGPVRPRTRPDAVLADKACSSRAIRAAASARSSPSPVTSRAHRKRRGSRGGRRPRRHRLLAEDTRDAP